MWVAGKRPWKKCVELIETTRNQVGYSDRSQLVYEYADRSECIYLVDLAGQKEKRKNDQNPDIKVSEELAPLNQEPSGRGALQGSTMEIGNQREQNPSACYPSSFIDLQLWESSKLYNQNTDRHFSF